MVQPQISPEIKSKIEAQQEAAPELGLEKEVGKPLELAEEKVAEATAIAHPASVVEGAALAPIKDTELIEIENILAIGLEDLFLKMPSEAQTNFKIKGEEVASKIKEMIETTKVKAKNILRLIVEWLRLIPGVNRLFLEQEAKIKTDQVLDYVEKKGDVKIE